MGPFCVRPRKAAMDVENPRDGVHAAGDFLDVDTGVTDLYWRLDSSVRLPAGGEKICSEP